MTNYLAPEQVPGRFNLNGQQRPAWLQEADRNYRDAIEATNALNEMFDGLRPEDEGTHRHLNIQSAIFAAQAFEFDCAQRAHELYQIWQSGGHPVVFHESMVIQTVGAMR